MTKTGRSWLRILVLAPLILTQCLTVSKTNNRIDPTGRIPDAWTGQTDFQGVFPWNWQDMDPSSDLHVAFLYPYRTTDTKGWDVAVATDLKTKYVFICSSGSGTKTCDDLERPLVLEKILDDTQMFLNPTGERIEIQGNRLLIFKAYDENRIELTHRVLQFLKKS